VDDLEAQIYRLLVMTAAGMGMGFGFDVFRAWRGVARPRGWAVHLSDLVFFCFTSVFLAVALVYGNWGELRLYVGAGLALGAVMYFRLGSPLLLAVLVRLFRIPGKSMEFVKGRARRSYARLQAWSARTMQRAVRRLGPYFRKDPKK